MAGQDILANDDQNFWFLLPLDDSDSPCSHFVISMWRANTQRRRVIVLGIHGDGVSSNAYLSEHHMRNQQSATYDTSPRRIDCSPSSQRDVLFDLHADCRQWFGSNRCGVFDTRVRSFPRCCWLRRVAGGACHVMLTQG